MEIAEETHLTSPMKIDLKIVKHVAAFLLVCTVVISFTVVMIVKTEQTAPIDCVKKIVAVPAYNNTKCVPTCRAC